MYTELTFHIISVTKYKKRILYWMIFISVHYWCSRCHWHGRSGSQIDQNDWQHRRQTGLDLSQDDDAHRFQESLSYMALPIVVHFNCVKFVAEYLGYHKLPLMCAKNYQIWLRRFKDISKNVRWPHFFGPRCIYNGSLSLTRYLHISLSLSVLFRN